MNLVDETRYRLACCETGTGTGWGELHSLRNHLEGRVQARIFELDPFVTEINRLPEDDGLRNDGIVKELLEEWGDLIKAKRLAHLYLNIVEPAERVEPVTETKVERTGRLKTILRQLGFPT
jgi:hypothetical protein